MMRSPRAWPLFAAAGLSVGLMGLGLVLLPAGTVVLNWTIPVLDVVNIFSLGVLATLCAIDCVVRRDQRSLRMVVAATALISIWAVHMLIFPGVLPARLTGHLSPGVSWIYYAALYATPLLLAWSLGQSPGELPDARRRVATAFAWGAAIAVAAALILLLAAPYLPANLSGLQFTDASRIFGGLSLVPAAVGLLLFARGRQGDPRLAIATAAALIFSLFGSLTNLLLHARYDSIWYADHLLTTLPYLVLLAGQLSLYGHSVVAERRLLAEARSARESMSQFLNLAAHELRTPASVIAGYVSLLREGTFGEVPAGWEKPLEIVAAKGRELTILVDNLLTAARLETAPTEAARADRKVDLVEAARQAVSRAQPRAGLLKGELVAELPAEHVQVVADEEGLSRILDNLINNALTYTSEQPKVRVVVSDHEPSVRIEDNGLGIPPKVRDRIFERFYRVDGHSRPASGTGLGLYISRQLAERYGGSLCLEKSEEGKGSSFLLQLPRAR